MFAQRQFSSKEEAYHEGLMEGKRSKLEQLFPPGSRVRYIPMHAHGDRGHPDCEDGIVSSCNHENVFVKYGGKQTAQATDPEDLIRL